MGQQICTALAIHSQSRNNNKEYERLAGSEDDSDTTSSISSRPFIETRKRNRNQVDSSSDESDKNSRRLGSALYPYCDEIPLPEEEKQSKIPLIFIIKS